MSNPQQAMIKQLCDDRKIFVSYANKLASGWSRPWAEDAVQECYIKAILNIHTFQHGTNIRAWFIAILRNHIYSQHRRSKFIRRITDINELEPEHQPILDCNEAIDEIYVDQVLSKIRTLDNRDNSVMLEMYLNGLCYSEISQEMGVPINTVKSRLSRFRDKIAPEVA